MIDLGRKQRSDHADWLRRLDELRADPVGTHARAVAIRAAYAEHVAEILPALGTVAFGWSGGKDSVVLEAILAECGIYECVLVICDLEWPEFMRWVTDHMPHGLTVEHRNLDLDWLARHPSMLFPDTAHASRWFSAVQHAGQAAYAARERVDTLILGRRRPDGNQIPAGGLGRRRARATFSPLADMTHDEVLTMIVGLGLPLAPCYGWPRGFQVGTGPWPARQWCASEHDGWRECWAIDPTVVRHAASRLPGAARFMTAAGVA